MNQLKPVAIIAVNNDTKKRSVTSLYGLQELNKGTILYAIPEGYALVKTGPIKKALETHIENTRELLSAHVITLGGIKKNSGLVKCYDDDIYANNIVEAEALIAALDGKG